MKKNARGTYSFGWVYILPRILQNKHLKIINGIWTWIKIFNEYVFSYSVHLSVESINISALQQVLLLIVSQALTIWQYEVKQQQQQQQPSYSGKVHVLSQ